MFKYPGNPIVLELTKTYTKRSIDLYTLQPLKTDQGKLCAWCYVERARGIKYCSTNCSSSARAWAYPQKEEGLNYLLIRQDFKCYSCAYDYNPLILQVLQNGRVYDKPNNYKLQLSWSLMRRIKKKSPKERRPEVDHVVPISKGGQSLGLDNHQAICYNCHKAKSKIDNSGPRNKKI